MCFVNRINLMLKIAFTPIYCHPLPENHRFPMAKYELLPQQLRYEGTVTDENFFTPTPLTEEDLLRVHKEDYWHRLQLGKLTKKEERATGFPWSIDLVEREVTINGGTIDTALYALRFGCSFNIAGGTHHAFGDRGEGFCLLNDIAIASAYLLHHQLAQKILVIDLDVHQGNGTAKIFENTQSVFTFSMHGGNNYPLRKEKSDLDIPLPDKADDKLYLGILQETLPKLFEEVEPDFVFYQSGVDILATDKLGRLSVSIAGCKERDRLVFQHCKQDNIPVAVSMGGGYSPQLSHIIEAHANTYRMAQSLFF